jgi:hypothetical protein
MDPARDLSCVCRLNAYEIFSEVLTDENLMIRKGGLPPLVVTASQAERGQAPFLTMSFFVLNYSLCDSASLSWPTLLGPELLCLELLSL